MYRFVVWGFSTLHSTIFSEDLFEYWIKFVNPRVLFFSSCGEKYEDIYFVYRIFFSRKGTSNDFIHTKNKRFSNYLDVGHVLRLYIIPIEGGWNVFSYASTS